MTQSLFIGDVVELGMRMVAATEKLYTFEKSAKIFAEAKVSIFAPHADIGVAMNKCSINA